MKINTTVERVGSYHFIPIPKEAAETILKDFGKRVIVIVNDNASIHCAILRTQQQGYYIMTGKATLKKINAQYGDELELEILKDETEYQMYMSEEFEEVFMSDLEGKALFDQLKAGQKRGLIHYVNEAKHSDTRIERALRVIENLKMGFTANKDLISKH